MSLAADILKRHGITLSPKAKRKPNAMYMELAKRNGRCGTGFPGVLKDTRHGTFVARVNRVSLGSFSTPERAYAAVCLRKLWLSRGYTDIPQGVNCGYIDYERYKY